MYYYRSLQRTVSTETITEKTRNNTGENIKPYTSNTVDCILSGLCIFGWLLAIVSMIEDKLKCKNYNFLLYFTIKQNGIKSKTLNM